MTAPRLVACAALGWCLLAASTAAAGVLVRISGEEFVHDITEAGGAVWIGTDLGAYRVEGNSTVSVLDGPAVTTIAEIDGAVWIGTERGVYRVDGPTVVPLFGDEIVAWVTAIQAAGDAVWIGTPQGLYRVESGIPERFSAEPVLAVQRIDAQVWVGTALGCFRIGDGGRRFDVTAGVVPVQSIVEADGSIWLVTTSSFGRFGPLLRVEEGEAVEEEALRGHEVIGVAEVEGAAWFSTTRGVFRLSGEELLPVEVPQLHEAVNTVALGLREVWIGSTHRAYRRTAGRFEPVPSPDRRDLNVKEIVSAGGAVWLRSSVGAFRHDEDVDLLLRPSVHSFFGISVLFGRLVKVEEARYDRGGQDPYGGAVRGDFEVVLQAHRERFDREVSEGSFTPARSLERTVPYGVQDLYLAVRDQFGNTARRTLPSVLVVPWRVVAVAAVPLLSALLGLVLVAAAPRWRLAMSLLMAPAVRKSLTPLSLWIISLALSVGAVRRWLLRRYLRELRSSDEFSGWADDSALATPDGDPIADLYQFRRVLLLGRSSDCRRHLRFLTWQLATHRHIRDRLGGAVPIFLRLDLYARDLKTIEEGLRAQLAAFGGITDGDLADRLLGSGEGLFIFLLDGLDRLESDGLTSVQQFLERYGRKNSTVAGVESRPEEVEGWFRKEIRLRSPDPIEPPDRFEPGERPG